MRSGFWSQVAERLDNQIAIYVALVANHSKHSPGTRGAKLGVTETEVFGTVGGGVMEHTIIEQGRRCLKDGKRTATTELLVHRESGTAKRSGLFCAGEQRMVYATVVPGSKAHQHICDAARRLENDHGGVLRVTEKTWSVEESAWSPPPIVFETGMAETDWYYQEVLFNPFRVAIIGGGHCGRALSKTMSELGYHVTNIDDRAEEALFVTNTWADRKIVADFSEAASSIEHQMLTHFVVMTANFPSDVAALKSVGNRPFPFIGVMGSAAKLGKIRRAIPKALFGKICAPIGLEMASDTPQEIAISIAAEILSLRGELFPWTLPD